MTVAERYAEMSAPGVAFLVDNDPELLRAVQRRTRVTGMLYRVRGSSLTSTSHGKDWRLFGQESSIVDDE